MIIKEEYKTREDGVILHHTYSDTDHKIRKVGTDEVYGNAIDELDFEYEEVDDGIRITRYNGDDEIVVIPEKIKGKQVISVSEYAFANNHTLKGLKIPDTISKIEKRSFQNCVELLIFVSGDELKIIDEYAFSGCSKLNNVVLNEGIEELKMSCFFATNLKEIYIPASVSIIDYPFSENNKDELTIIALDSSVAHNFAIENGYGYTAK